MSSVWDDRAQAYRESEARRGGARPRSRGEWVAARAPPSMLRPAVDMLARRLREAGLEVVTTDRSPGMEPDVLCPAEDLPFANRSFDVVACRVAAHHFGDVGAAIREMARVAADRVLLVDNLFMSDDAEEADRVRDASHVRIHRGRMARLLRGGWPSGRRGQAPSTSRSSWRPGSSRPAAAGEEAERVRSLLADRIDGQLGSAPRAGMRAPGGARGE